MKASKSTNARLAGSPIPGLRALAELVGVECEYVDGRGHSHQATDATLRMILGALGIDAQLESDIQREWKDIQEERWTRLIEPVLLHYPEARTSLCFPIAVPLGAVSLDSVEIEIRLKDEQGKIRSFPMKGVVCTHLEDTMIRGIRYVRRQVNLPGRFQLGYYDLLVTIQVGSRVLEAKSLVISAPQRCYLPAGSKRKWGIGVQLYGIRSQKNWGIGDFRDLERIMRTAGRKWKASTIGLQPLHSLTPGLHSPYSPSSRLCWNPMYLNVEQVAEFRLSSKFQRMFQTKKFQDTLRALRSSRFVEYEAVHQLKISVLEELFRVFKRHHLLPRTTRGRAFIRFVQKAPEFLRRFCTFQALSDYFGGAIWREWPLDYHEPTSPAVERFQKKHAARIHYFYYVQWLCELQLSRLDQVAQKSSLSLGLYHDLPVGIHPDGADAWGFQGQLAKDATIGAPPDSFNLQGQNWGLLAPNPRALRQHGYDFWRQTLRQNMRHGGVLRIDHALGLFRMFWVPFGHSGQDGLYVKTYVDEMLAVLALESVRHKVMVVGEDLGTVTPVIQRKLEGAGLLSYRLLFFERDYEGAFHHPSQFPSQALVSATTHDLPTLKGFWEGRDIEIKGQAGLYTQPEDRDFETLAREEDRRQLWKALLRAGFAVSDTRPATLSPGMVKMFYQFLAQTPSRLLMIQLEDVLGELDTPNLPGAADSVYPSWRVRLSRALTSWLNDPAHSGLAQAVSRERRKRRASAVPHSTKK
ncbi:MAG: 4-alpha-glucanotransferase [Nitrospirales bacterium]